MVLRRALALLLLLLLAPAVAQAGSDPVLDYATKLTVMTVSLPDEDGYVIQCTAFFVGHVREYPGYALMMTAGHCAPAVDFFLQGNTLRYVSWRAYTAAPGYDAAVGITSTPMPVADLRIRTSPLVPGETLYTVGFGRGHFHVHAGVYRGVAHDLYPDYVSDDDPLDWGVAEFDGDPMPGSSGSAVLDAYGDLVGIHVYGIRGTTGLAGFTTVAAIGAVVAGRAPFVPAPARKKAVFHDCGRGHTVKELSRIFSLWHVALVGWCEGR